jgi:hypothetical protein
MPALVKKLNKRVAIIAFSLGYENFDVPIFTIVAFRVTSHPEIFVL